MSISSVKNAHNYALLQNLFTTKSAPADLQSGNDLTASLLKSTTATSVNGFDVLTLSPEALKRKGSEGQEGANDNPLGLKPRGSGEMMVSKEEHRANVEAYMKKLEELERKSAGASDLFWAKLGADNPWRQHDNGMTYEQVIKWRLGATSTEASYKQYATPQSFGEFTAQIKDRIDIILKHEGLSLNADEKIDITLEKRKYNSPTGEEMEGEFYVVGGLKDAEKQKRIEEALNEGHIIDNKFFGMAVDSIKYAYYMNTDYAKDSANYSEIYSKASLIDLKDSVGDMSHLTGGVKIDWSTLRRNEDGSYSGYPEELEWVFTGDFSKAPEGLSDIGKTQIWKQIMTPVNKLLAAGYDNIPTMDYGDVKISYSANGIEV